MDVNVNIIYNLVLSVPAKCHLVYTGNLQNDG